MEKPLSFFHGSNKSCLRLQISFQKLLKNPGEKIHFILLGFKRSGGNEKVQISSESIWIGKSTQEICQNQFFEAGQFLYNFRMEIDAFIKWTIRQIE